MHGKLVPPTFAKLGREAVQTDGTGTVRCRGEILRKTTSPSEWCSAVPESVTASPIQSVCGFCSRPTNSIPQMQSTTYNKLGMYWQCLCGRTIEWPIAMSECFHIWVILEVLNHNNWSKANLEKIGNFLALLFVKG